MGWCRASRGHALAGATEKFCLPLDFNPIGIYTENIPPRTEGCLISVSRRGAGSGGRTGASEMRRELSHPAVQAASSRRASRAPLGPRDGGCRRPVTGFAGPDLGLRAVDRRV